MPYPYISEQQSLARRRALAQALQSQSFEPLQEPNYPGAAISPVQGVARMVQALMGGLAQRRLDKEQTGLESRIQDERTRRALQMMDALVPQAQGSSVHVGMAPMQSMSYPGGASQDMTPPGDRSVGFPPSSQALDTRSRQVQALGAGFASPMPAEQGMAQALLAQMGQQRGQQFEAGQNALNRGVTIRGQDITAQNYASEAAFRAAQAAADARRIQPIPKGAAIPDPAHPGQFIIPSPDEVPPKVNFSNAGIPYSITDANKKEYVIGAPDMPPPLKSIADAALASHRQRMQEQSDITEAAAMRQDARDQARAQRQAERDLELARLRNSNAPDQLKAQVNAAYTTKDMVDIVRGIVEKKPHLLGPVTGRLEKTGQASGSSFGLQSAEDERDAATLAGHLEYLFANESRAAFPQRTDRETRAELRKASAQMHQNPNMVEGFLRSAENNAHIAITGGKRWGINLGPAAPANIPPPPPGFIPR